MKEGLSYSASLDSLLEITPYNIFELRGEELPLSQQDSDPNVIPPLSMFNLIIQPKHNQLASRMAPERENHFGSDERGFYWSQRRYVQPPLVHVTCFSYFGVFAFGVLYASFTFMIYASYVSCCERVHPHKTK
mmetsp:Transcript_7492/g.6799  ORF Transcript_7492/g.6799 Transcript_7492/m.6799 type:complete len:133 (+) Transcript_7492:2935-3333(+)